MDVIQTFSDFTKICRACLATDVNLIPLHAYLSNNKNTTFKSPVTVRDILMNLVSVADDEQDCLPSSICESCKNILESAYEFKLKYEHSSTILQMYLSNLNSMKTEVEDNGSDHDLCSNDECHEEVKTETCEIGQDNEFLIPCPICTTELPALELRKHALTHKDLEKYLNIPKISSKTRFYARPRNTETIFNEIEIKHKCPHCELEVTADNFRSHVAKHKEQGEYKCDKCDRVFDRINHLNIHKLWHLKQRPYKCDKCGKGFAVKKNYDCHLLTHTNTLPHACSFCGRGFSNPEHLHRHQIIHTENITYSLKYKVLKCKQCLKSFKEQDRLKSHKCVPTKKQEGHYYHRAKKSNRPKSYRGLCTVCGKYVTNYHVHMQNHTGKKPHKCKECFKQFANKTVLQKHLLVHSGVKPFVCAVCGKAFNNFYNLQVHERIHSGNRCHVCTICNKGFLEKSYLRKHMKIHEIVAK